MEFFIVQEKVDVLSEFDDDNERQSFETNYFSIVSRAHVLINNIKTITAQDEAVASLSNQQELDSNFSPTNVKLTIMNLPKFDGKYTGWLEIRDAFDSLIHCSSTLSKSASYGCGGPHILYSC